MKTLRIEIREKDTGKILAHGRVRKDATKLERRRKACVLHDRTTWQEVDTYVVERFFEDGIPTEDTLEAKYCSTEINEIVI
jgi:hypothetical protein